LHGLKLITLLGYKLKNNVHPKTIEVSSLALDNRLGLAAGLDKNGDFIDSLAALGFGFLEIGTVTPRPQLGNSKPRLIKLIKEKALVNKMGFNNKGVDYLIEKLVLKKSNIPLGISIGKNFDTPNSMAFQDYIICLNKVYEHCSYIAVNISSPNTKDLRNLQSRAELDNLLKKLKVRQNELALIHGYKPLFVKISPDNSNSILEGICESLLKNKIDGVICSNTTSDHNYFKGEGGLSGSPLLNKSTNVLKFIRKKLGKDFPIIASGGVMTANNFEEKLASGADLVQIYTGFIYEGPNLVKKIIDQDLG